MRRVGGHPRKWRRSIRYEERARCGCLRRAPQWWFSITNSAAISASSVLADTGIFSFNPIVIYISRGAYWGQA